MRPDQAKFLMDFLLPRLKFEQAITKKILSAVPPNKGGPGAAYADLGVRTLSLFSSAILQYRNDLQILEKSADSGKISSALTSCIQTTYLLIDKYITLWYKGL